MWKPGPSVQAILRIKKTHVAMVTRCFAAMVKRPVTRDDEDRRYAAVVTSDSLVIYKISIVSHILNHSAEVTTRDVVCK